MSQTTDDKWTVIDHANDDNGRSFESRADAEKAVETVKEFGGDPELFAPEEGSESDQTECSECGETHSEGACWDEEGNDEWPEEPCGICGEPVSIAEAKSGPGRQPIHPECPPDSRPDNVEVVNDVNPEPTPEPEMDELPDRSVSDDPLSWMPGHFIDQIDGTPAINRKGFEVLAHHYNISTTSDLEVAPEDTDHEYVRVKARATTEDGREAEAYGSAHVDRGDDSELLLEMADTRARKRALSIATGVGVVAVAEMKNEVEQ